MVQKTLGNCSKRCAKGSMRQPMTLRCTPPAEGPTPSLLAATLSQYFFFCKCIGCPVLVIFTGIFFTHAVFVQTQNVYRIVTF